MHFMKCVPISRIRVFLSPCEEHKSLSDQQNLQEYLEFDIKMWKCALNHVKLMLRQPY